MRFAIPFFYGGLTVASGFFGWLIFKEPDQPPPPCPSASENDRLRAELHRAVEEQSRAERERDLWIVYAGIWRHRLTVLGTPQSWPGPTVSTVYPARPAGGIDPNLPPETIPPQNLPTVPKEGN